MSSEVFRIKISKKRFFLATFILVAYILLVFVFKIKMPRFVTSLATVSLVLFPIFLYKLASTHLSIQENTLVGWNGIFSRVNIPVNRITRMGVTRDSFRLGGRNVFILTKSRTLLKIRFVENYEDLIDKLEELNQNIFIDDRF